MDSQSHGTDDNTQDPEVIMTSPSTSLVLPGFTDEKNCVRGKQKNLDKKLFSHQLKQKKKPRSA